LEQSPSSEAEIRQLVQEVPHLLWNLIHRNSPMDPVLSHLNPS